MLQSLAVDSNSTHLSLTSAAVDDMNGNAVVPVTETEPEAVTIYTPDTTEPQLLRFTLDLTEETLTLFFSETVNVSSIDVTGITLQSDLTGAISVALTNASVSTENGPVVILQLSQLDLNRLKNAEELAYFSK